MKLKYNSSLSAAKPQIGGPIQHDRVRRRWSALTFGGLLVTSICALSAPSLEAQCKQWNVGHAWRFKQGALIVNMDLHQEGIVVTGTASFTGTTKKSEGGLFGSFGATGTINGTVDGTVEDDQYAVKIYWDNNDIGIYTGTIRPSGRIEGKGYEQKSRRIKVNWYSETTMKCADAAVQPTKPAPNVPASTPKPIKSTGKSKVSPAVPFIVANPIAVTAPEGQSQGTTTLTWDAGPNHPNVIVWSREGVDGKTTVVDTREKGTRTVAVDRGKNYQFILMETGEQLAKAVVISKP
jgi:hypothetical protein